MEKNIITEELFLKNAEKLKNRKKIKIFVAELDSEIEFDHLSREKYIDLIIDGSDDRDAEIIYYSCSELRNESLIERLGCKSNPVDVVGKVLSGKTIFVLAKTILKESGYTFDNPNEVAKTIGDEVKNY